MSDERMNSLESEISTTREHMDATLREIERRLEPEHLIKEGWNYVRHSGANEFVANLGSSVKENPLPITFVALGMAWLMISGQRSGATGRVSDAVSSAGSDLAATTRRASAGASEAVHELGERASRTADAAREQLDRARRSYRHLRDEQPLALGAIGLAIGAVIAMALPRTSEEEELMGDASRRVAEKARETGQEAMQRAPNVVAAAADAAVQESVRPTGSDARPRDESRRATAAERSPDRESARDDGQVRRNIGGS